MTPQEIIEILEICSHDCTGGYCERCPYAGKTADYEDGCGRLLADAAMLLRAAYEAPENNAETRKQEFRKMLYNSGLSQSEAARRLHIAASYVSKICTGAVAPSMALLLEARTILGKEPEANDGQTV